FVISFSLLLDAKPHPIGEVESLPVRSEGGHVMRIHARNTLGWWCTQGVFRIETLLELDNVHLPNSVPLHAPVDGRWHGSEILSHQSRLVEVGFERKQSVQFFSRISDVSALLGRKALGNPIEPVQAHDVVDAEQVGVPHLKSNEFKPIAITLPAYACG